MGGWSNYELPFAGSIETKCQGEVKEQKLLWNLREETFKKESGKEVFLQNFFTEFEILEETEILVSGWWKFEEVSKWYR